MSRHNRWFAVLAPLLLPAAYGYGQVAQNGFEQDESGKPPASVAVWAPKEGAGAGACVVSDVRVHTGKQALRFDLPKGGYIVASQFLPVIPSKNYRFGACVFLEPGTTAAASTNIYWSSGPTEAGRLAIDPPGTDATRGTGEWTDRVLVAAAPPGATHAQVVLRFSGKGAEGAGVAYWDDVAMEQIADGMVLGPGGKLVERVVVANADFAGGAATALDGWTLETENGDYTVSRELDKDNPAAKLVFAGRGEGKCRGALISAPVRLGKPASHYRVSCRVRGRNAMCRLLVHFHDATTDEKLNFWATNTNVAADWKSIGGTIRILPRFQDRELVCRIELRLVGAGEAWFDDVTLAPVAAPNLAWKKDAVYRWDPKSPQLILRQPAADAAVLTNPPAFVFPPLMEAKSYRVELSDTSGFEKVVVASPSLAYNSYLHSAPLAADKPWYWRTVALDAAGQPLQTSDAWRFTIAPSAVAWPFPAVAELASRAGPHPRLYVTPATLEQDRVRVLADPRWPAFLAAAERSLTAEVKPEPVDYWDFDPWGEVYKYLYGPSSAMQNVYVQCAFAYLMTQDKRFLDKAKQFMLEQATWDPEGPTCFQWQDQVGRAIMLNMSIAYDWLCNDLTPEERAALEAAVNGAVRAALPVREEFLSRELAERELDLGRLPEGAGG